jgi:transcriptional regulator with XRE-family HTH domain
VREREGISVADLAARTGIDEQRINAIEAGQIDPAFDVMVALADGIGVRLSALIPRASRTKIRPDCGWLDGAAAG